MLLKLYGLLVRNPIGLFFVTVTIYTIIFLLLNDEDSNFINFFFHFGPGINDATTASFLKKKISTWKDVIIGYTISFLAGFLVAQYTIVTTDIITSEVFGGGKSVCYKKWELILLLFLIPFILVSFTLGSGITFDSFQLQFVLFFILGCELALLPHAYIKSREKIFMGPHKSSCIRNKLLM